MGRSPCGRSRCTASSRSKASSATPNSGTSPDVLMRASASGGSARVPNASCAPGGSPRSTKATTSQRATTGEQVRVVEHQQEGRRLGQRLVQQRQHALLHRRDRQRERASTRRIDGDDGGEGPDELEEEHDRVVVGLVHLHPDDGALVGRRPLRERRRLAGPRGGAEKDQRLGGTRERRDEGAPLDELHAHRGRTELRRSAARACRSSGRRGGARCAGRTRRVARWPPACHHPSQAGDRPVDPESTTDRSGPPRRRRAC